MQASYVSVVILKIRSSTHDAKARMHRSTLGSLYASESEEETRLKKHRKAKTKAKKNKRKDIESPPDLLKREN